MISRTLACWVLVSFSSLCAAAASKPPETVSFQTLHVQKKPGARTGVALVTINDKSKRLASRVLDAWPVMGGHNALVLVLQPVKNAPAQNRLRFYEGATRKYHDLGAIILSSATLGERKLSDDSWAFVLSGTANHQPAIVIAGTQGIHGLLLGARNPKFENSSLSFTTASGERKSAPLHALLAQHMTAIYHNGSHYVQFLPDNSAVLQDSNASYTSGTWRTDGENMIFLSADGQRTSWPRQSLTAATGIPAGTRLNLRLLAPLDSTTAKEDDPVRAVLISTATIHNAVLLPQGVEFDGHITKAHSVGWAFKHETAALTIDFDSVKLPDGTSLPIHTRLYQVENSRESIKDGTIEGVRSTGTPGYSAETKIASIAAFDPVAFAFTTTAATATLGFAEPEILYPAGTELLVEFTAPLLTSKTFPRTVPEFPGDEAAKRQLAQMIRNLSFRTYTVGGHKPSDLTNLVFIGSSDGLRRAFKAAGWIGVDALNANSTFMTVKTVGGNQIYNEAPMSTLLLDERAPILTLSKTTNTFYSRHHLRVFDPLTRYNGQTVLTSSSTQDIGIAFSRKQKTFIHVIDEYIDNERSKVVNDLEFTGCVENMDLVPRSWVPRDAFNSTGDKLITDGAIAVMRISDCTNPRTTPETPAERPNRFKRVTRDTVLTLRNDIYRGNLVYQGVTGILWTRRYFLTRDQLKPHTGAWRTTDQSGTEFKGIGEISRERAASAEASPAEETAAARALVKQHRWDPPHYEIAVSGGYLNYVSEREEAVAFLGVPRNLNDPSLEPYAAVFADRFRDGWTVGLSLTLNTWKWFSNEFSYNYQRGKFEYVDVFTKPEVMEEEGTVGLVARQFEYNLLWNLRPPTSRWRPYFAAGPALMLTSLSGATLKKAAGPFKIGLQNVGLLVAAFDTGSTPPLEGGGIFSAGFTYGAGIKFRVHPRITLRADFRQTWSKNPEFASNSYTKQYFEEDGYDSTIVRGGLDHAYHPQRFTLGVAFTF